MAPPAVRLWISALLTLAALLAMCQEPVADVVSTPASAVAPDDVAQTLQGTWLREYADQGGQARRVLALEADGRFRERVRAQGTGGEAMEQEHEGTWLFDGTNLKRKYTLMNGKPPSRLNLPFATFQISFETRDEFVGIDHIRGHRIRYRRVAEGTTP